MLGAFCFLELNMNPIIITGGPGAGKTTLLNALDACGYATFPEGVSRLD